MREMKERHPRRLNQIAHLPMPPLFKALFDHALDVEHIDVDIRRTNVRGALFSTEPCDGGLDPFISVGHPERVGNFDDVVDTIHLAHELGHHKSWLLEEASEELEDVMMYAAEAFRSHPERYEHSLRLEAYEDEARAWLHARAILEVAVGAFDEWDRFEREQVSALEGYRNGLRLNLT